MGDESVFCLSDAFVKIGEFCIPLQGCSDVGDRKADSCRKKAEFMEDDN